MEKNIRIALGQMRAVQGDTESNWRKMEQMISQAAKQKADLICFPELSYNGYFVGREQLKEQAETKDGRFYQLLSGCAKKHGIFAAAGYAEQEGEDVYNSCLFVDKRGELIGNVRKRHLWKSEKKRFKAGVEIPVFETELGKIAVLLCYDLEFPEPARIASIGGAELILCPAAWSIPARVRWEVDLRANSLFNLLFTAGANFTDELCCGCSAVAGPDGVLKGLASPDQEEVLVVPADLSQVEKQRQAIPYFEDLDQEWRLAYEKWANTGKAGLSV